MFLCELQEKGEAKKYFTEIEPTENNLF